MIENSHEQHVVELPWDGVGFVHRKFFEFNIQSERIGRKPGLVKVAVININTNHSARAAPLHLDRVKPGVAAQVEHRCTLQVLRKNGSKILPLNVREISKKMMGRCEYPEKINVVKPFSQFPDFALNLCRLDCVGRKTHGLVYRSYYGHLRQALRLVTARVRPAPGTCSRLMRSGRARGLG